LPFGTNDEAVKAYESGRCDVLHHDVSGLMRSFEAFKSHRSRRASRGDLEEPLGPMVRHGDDQCSYRERVLFAMIDAEELGVTQKNVDTWRNRTSPS